jgi:hypothetical protein
VRFKSNAFILIRLALVNAMGYGAGAVMPIWVGDIAATMGMPAWFAGLAATSQLVAAALLNLSTPLIFRSVAALPLARGALVVATAVALVIGSSGPMVFYLACVVLGACTGILLNVTNHIIAGSVEVQKGYSIFQIVEVAFAASLYFGASTVAQQYGLLHLFRVLAATWAIGWALLWQLPLGAIQDPAVIRGNAGAGGRSATLALAAFTIFLLGQSSINSFMIPIGRAMGLTTRFITSTVAAGTVCALVGASLTRVLGERIGVRWPVIIAATLLASNLLLMTVSRTHLLFVTAAVLLPSCTVFAAPYFFTLLAKLDRAGQYASIAPAFILTGAAIGPSIAVFVSGNYGTPVLGTVASLSLTVAAGMFAVAASASITGVRNDVRAHEGANP